ncbi:Wzz/FepE/Etk N-terminal domain-containing protein [Thalassotalea euphylliae]|uniref:Wzz/FepE/Etk N-terminal domain-containing protein n=1 Tax=Thalassotalea euphylliae TaxID=1655234 RepID=UPI00363533D2
MSILIDMVEVREKDEISLTDVWREIWKKKIFVIIVGISFTALAIALAISLPNKYTAKVLLVPIKEEQDGLASLAKSFGGLAGMAGLKLGRNRGPDKTDIALEVLKSQTFIEAFIKKHNLAVPLMAAKNSDPVTYELEFNEKVYDVKASKWIREVKAPKTPEPSAEELSEAFLKILEIEVVPKTGFVQLSVEFFSPVLAQQWLTLLVEEINSVVKEQDKREALSSLDYLNEVILQTDNRRMHETFYQLIEEQTKTLMLVESRPEYVLKTVAPAVVPEKRTSPKRALIVVFGGLVGGILAVLFVVIRFILK